jgi:hypothetical protein
MRAGVRLRSREGDLRSRSAISLQKHSALIINTFTSFGTRVLARAREQWLLVAIGTWSSSLPACALSIHTYTAKVWPGEDYNNDAL